MRYPRIAVAAGLGSLAALLSAAAFGSFTARPAPGENPHPVRLVRPLVVPLTAVAALGRAIFFDPALSASRKLSCASCHDPAHAYGPPDGRAARMGGPALARQGVRAVPSLRYLDRVPPFGVGPGAGVIDADAPPRPLAHGVPHGGLFWDGRAPTLQSQALIPLFNPSEMANTSVDSVAVRLRHAAYGARFAQLFGEQTVSTSQRLVDEAMFAVARFEMEDVSFHPYTSKYDAYLEGKATLTPVEARGLEIFEDSAKGNCSACHTSRPGPDLRPPTFTDYEYEALGVPRNDSLGVNRDPRYHDLGLCGPARTDLADRHDWCGLFRTPTLRNVATRKVFFHNGVYHTLREVLEFYAFRDTRPGRIYPRAIGDRVRTFDDLPARYRGNVDTADAPFDRHAGDAPALTAREIEDVLAFLNTLTDGYEGVTR